jgi:hypothetical protein
MTLAAREIVGLSPAAVRDNQAESAELQIAGTRAFPGGTKSIVLPHLLRKAFRAPRWHDQLRQVNPGSDHGDACFDL